MTGLVSFEANKRRRLTTLTFLFVRLGVHVFGAGSGRRRKKKKKKGKGEKGPLERNFARARRDALMRVPRSEKARFTYRGSLHRRAVA